MMTKQEAIATILVNQRVMRNGSLPISNVLDMIPARLKEEVMGDAEAVIEGLAACEVPSDGAGINAAAPDLYAACEAVLNSDMAMREEDEGRVSDMLNMVRAAVKKARGEEKPTDV